MDLKPHIERFRRRFAELEKELENPDLFNDQKRAQEITREHARTKEALAKFANWEKLTEEKSEAEELMASKDPDMVIMAEEELARLNPLVEKALQEARFTIVPPDENDSRNTMLEIRGGTGGSEAGLFAADLCRMYTRYAEREGWKVETMDASPGELGGLKEVILLISGQDVYKKLRYESGVHRVQRVPATEAQGRIHTSAATVAVLPEAKDVDLVIRPDELRIEVCRAGGPGGQGVNTTDSAVQILHIPTGLIVRCQDGRSQLKNKERALSILRSRLLEKKQEDENAKYAANRRDQIGSGGRNEKIRTYNFPQNRVTDHRVNLTLYNLSEVMEGDIMELTDVLMASALEKQLAEMDNLAKA
ncbi:MAG: peptide chain release factor 1 [Candidatus Methylacidiphilales bacterium]|nr:peptide chain release factor 1 [Candidatus Methylacidiphilales bacterium]